ncbi:MAG: rhodanese-like domain-containing protein [bacterium]
MPTGIKSASVQETFEVLRQNTDAVMIDVREQSEVDAVAPSVGLFFPMSKINPETFAKDCKVRQDQPIFLFCLSGGRSMRVAEALAKHGFKDLTNVSGGVMAWQAQGLPLKGR